MLYRSDSRNLRYRHAFGSSELTPALSSLRGSRAANAMR